MHQISTSARGVRAAIALALLALVAILASAAPAGAAVGDEKKPSVTPINPTDALPDRASPKFEASPAAAVAVKQLQERIGSFVEKNGTKYTFATRFDSESGRIVIDTDAPADLLAELTKLDDPKLQREVEEIEVRKSTIEDGGTVATTSSRSGAARASPRVGHLLGRLRGPNAAGTVFSVTAGHCFANGVNALVESGLRSYGTVSGRRLPTVTGHPMDMECSAADYVGRVYTGAS